VAERGRDVRLRHRLAHLDVLWTTTMQREIPEESISRVSAYDIFGSLAFAPLGLLLSGPIAAAIGPRAALLGCAGLVTAATLAALTSPAVRKLTAPMLPWDASPW
jgi:hypothetical protein